MEPIYFKTPIYSYFFLFVCVFLFQWECLWTFILFCTFSLLLVWFYFWWEAHNDYSEFNW